MKHARMALALILAFASTQFVQAQEEEREAPERKKVAYMGIRTGAIPELLVAQLNLQERVGLVVQYVDPKGPSKEQLKRHDIIMKLNDQKLFNHDQLAALVRTMKPGDKVVLEIMRSGKTSKVNLILGETVPRNMRWRRPGGELNDDMIGEMMDEDEMFRNAPNLEKTRRAIMERMERHREEMRRRQGEHGKRMHEEREDREVVSRVMSMTDGGLNGTLREDNGEKQFTVKDKDGTVIFNGPVNTEDERTALAPEVAKLLKLIESRKIRIRR